MLSSAIVIVCLLDLLLSLSMNLLAFTVVTVGMVTILALSCIHNQEIISSQLTIVENGFGAMIASGTESNFEILDSALE